uniref:Uncharacterized protein n=1 Tax=Meloidogyne enterolobii TaxID=390850 RepID=A0A6V7V5K6_MELEN|nr:unnamed protein product [Meloidogyne enterolobii]
MNIEKLLIFFNLFLCCICQSNSTKYISSKTENNKNKKERHPNLLEDENENFDRLLKIQNHQNTKILT